MKLSNRVPGKYLGNSLVGVSVDKCPGRKVREDRVFNKVLNAHGVRHSGAASTFLPRHTKTLLQAKESFPRVFLLYLLKNSSSPFYNSLTSEKLWPGRMQLKVGRNSNNLIHSTNKKRLTAIYMTVNFYMRFRDKIIYMTYSIV